MAALLPQLALHTRLFLSAGRSALKLAHRRPPGQTWIVRGAGPFSHWEGSIQLNPIGPCALVDERVLLHACKVDALMAKNSGAGGVLRQVGRGAGARHRRRGGLVTAAAKAAAANENVRLQIEST